MKILMLTHRLPYAPDRGDRIRAYFMARELSREAEVHLVSLVHDDEEAAMAGSGLPVASVTTVRVPRWRNHLRAAASLAGERPLTHALLHAPRLARVMPDVLDRVQPDVVLLYCTGVAAVMFEPWLRDYPCVLDMVDVDSAKWLAMGQDTRGPLGWIYRREARCLALFERRAVEAAAATLVVNSRERVLLQEMVSACDPRVIPNGVALDYFRRPETATERADVVFCGVMNYAPNADAAVRLARDIWPGVRAARPDARLVIVGASPTPAVRRLATYDSSVVVTGRVPDVRPHLWDAAVSVAPLRTARGLQNKVLEALAAGLPVVTSRAVFDGLPDGVRIGCVEADTTDATAAAVLGLLALSPAQRRAKAAAARVDRLAWSHQLSDLLPLLRSVQRRPGAEVRPRLSLAARRVPADERQSAATVT